MGKIRVGVIGVGNCFAGLIQGIQYYERHPEMKLIGLMYDTMPPGKEGYSIFDIQFTSAFDVGKNKIGKPLHEAIYEPPNLVDWVPKLEPSKVIVKQSPELDGIGIYTKEKIGPILNRKSKKTLAREIIKEVEGTGTEILINYLPVGSHEATRFWSDIAVKTGCAFVNCIPEFIASRYRSEERFRDYGLPVIGDDIKSQVGATITHRVLTKLCVDRGTVIDKTYQVNVGGNTDFANMLERERLKSKKISKTEAVRSLMPEGAKLSNNNIYIGPSDFIPFLGNTKIAFIRLEGRMFANVPYNMEVRLEVDDKANSAGVAVDAIRCAKIALDRNHVGAVEPACAFYMKHPPERVAELDDGRALQQLEAWLSEV